VIAVGTVLRRSRCSGGGPPADCFRIPAKIPAFPGNPDIRCNPKTPNQDARHVCEIKKSWSASFNPVATLGGMNADARWKQRFHSFDRALALLREAMEGGPAALNQLEKEGAIQRFEYSVELAWKTAKDFLEDSGLVIDPVTPRQVIKQAFAAKIVSDGQVWIDMLNHRNLLSHTYDCALFEKAVEALAVRYLPAIEQMHQFFTARAVE
jgi:nucleotidyltransferase substrate binding protein (TIGR01987 family)